MPLFSRSIRCVRQDLPPIVASVGLRLQFRVAADTQLKGQLGDVCSTSETDRSKKNLKNFFLQFSTLYQKILAYSLLVLGFQACVNKKKKNERPAYYTTRVGKMDEQLAVLVTYAGIAS
jgi:hypothetical protein